MLKKVRPGQRLVHSAAHHNAVIDLHRAPPPRQPPRRPAVQQTGCFLLRNDTEYDLPAGGVLAITGPLYASDNARYRYLPAFTGDVPTEADAGRFGVLAGPAPAGRLKPAVLAGITAVQVRIAHDAHEFAEVDPGHADRLVTVDCGSAQILFRDAGEVGQVVWATVRLANRCCCCDEPASEGSGSEGSGSEGSGSEGSGSEGSGSEGSGEEGYEYGDVIIPPGTESGTATVVVNTEEGNPAPSLEVDVTEGAVFIYSGYSYDPSTEGELTSLDFDIDVYVISGGIVFVSAIQDGLIYEGSGTNSASWNTISAVSVASLTGAGFNVVDGPPILFGVTAATPKVFRIDNPSLVTNE